MSSSTINNLSINKYFNLNPNVLYKFSDFILSPNQELLFHGDEVVKLSKKSIQCLMLLVANANTVVMKDTFFETVWENKFVEEGVLTVNIWNLRKVLGKECITTFHQRGYKFNGEVVAIPSNNTIRKNTFISKEPTKFESLVKNFKLIFVSLF